MKTQGKIFFALSLIFLFSFSCKKEKETPPTQETGSVKDADGNSYRTVKIGNQWWMAENLRVTHYRNGTILPIGNSDVDWSSATKGTYCTYDGKPENAKTYGYLYNWFAVNDSNKLAPEGWHIPTDAEWQSLETEIGMSADEANKLGWRGRNEGDKLKIEAPIGWTEVTSVWGTNTSGFTALAGGCRLFNGKFSTPYYSSSAFWWSTSEYNTNEAWYRNLDKKNSNVFRSHTYKTYGCSVRCVKD